jgi:hypothetical protein
MKLSINIMLLEATTLHYILISTININVAAMLTSQVGETLAPLKG